LSAVADVERQDQLDAPRQRGVRRQIAGNTAA
jgi:hypothetical protein